MAAISPPTKPPVLKGYGGRDNTPYIREIYDDEKSLICDTWIRSAKLTTSDADQLAEVASICDSVRRWKAGTGGARKRRSALPSKKDSQSRLTEFTNKSTVGDDVDAIACLQMGPDNSSFTTFFMQVRVDFKPLKELYGGRFFIASVSM
eukprot:15439-Heterococcus_DN1.PRE.1